MSDCDISAINEYMGQPYSEPMGETKHTIEQLQQMPDSELAELAARLRGYREKISIFGDCEVSVMLTDENGAELMSAREWNPPADIGQAYGLLVWAKEQGKVGFSIHIGRLADELECFINGYWRFSLPGNDARAMCYTFVLAMEAING